MCDDHEAFAVVGPGLVDSGDEIPTYSMKDISDYRNRYPIVCSDAEAAVPVWKCVGDGLADLRAHLAELEEPPEPADVLAWAEGEGLDCFDAAAERRRYVYVAAYGPMFPQASVDEAVEAYRREAARSEGAWKPAGHALGYWGPEYPLESPSDRLAVLWWSVSVSEGVVRGIAQNQSATLWARDVSVTATDTVGNQAQYAYGLSVQPGEVMPFEIEDWQGTSTPSDIQFEVVGDMSSRIDLSRSVLLEWRKWDLTREDLMALFPEQMAVGEATDEEFVFVDASIKRHASTAHPRLAESAVEQTIENLAVYAATFFNGAVFDVIELTPMVYVSSSDSWDGSSKWLEARSIPAELPDGQIRTQPNVGMIAWQPLVWVGSANQTR